MFFFLSTTFLETAAIPDKKQAEYELLVTLHWADEPKFSLAQNTNYILL